MSPFYKIKSNNCFSKKFLSTSKQKIFFLFIVSTILFIFFSSQILAEKAETFIVALKNKNLSCKVFKNVLSWKQIGNSRLFKIKVNLSEQNIIEFLKHDPRVRFVEKIKQGSFNNLLLTKNLAENNWFKEINGYKIKELSLHKKVIVALIDSGIDFNTSFYSNHIFINSNEIPGDGIDNDHNGYTDDVYGWDFGERDNYPQDVNGHGSMITSLILSLCPDALILPLKINRGLENEFTIDHLVEAIYYAIQMGAKVINLSLTLKEISPSVEEAIKDAYRNGIIIIASAGNDPSSIAFPASMNETISVGSVYNEIPAWFSPSGPALDLVAPGVGIKCLGIGGIETLASGTSLSAAIVSGVCADLLSMNPYLTSDHIKEFLMRSCRDLGEIGKDIYFGAGEIDGNLLQHVVKPAIILPQHPFYSFNANWTFSIRFYLPPTDVITNIYIALEDPNNEIWFLDIQEQWKQDPNSIAMVLINDFLRGILFGDNGVFPAFNPFNFPEGLYKWWIGVTDIDGNLLTPPNYSYMLLFK